MLKHRILIVEDDPTIVQNLEILFKREYEVVIAGDGETGLSHAKMAEPDIIILDLYMPKMSGMELCENLKMISRLENIPIIVITGKASEDEMEDVKKMGVDLIVRKPFEMQDLFNKVYSFLKHVPKKPKEFSIYEIRGYK